MSEVQKGIEMVLGIDELRDRLATAEAAARKCGEEMATVQARADKAERERDRAIEDRDRVDAQATDYCKRALAAEARDAELERDLAAARAEDARLVADCAKAYDAGRAAEADARERLIEQLGRSEHDLMIRVNKAESASAALRAWCQALEFGCKALADEWERDARNEMSRLNPDRGNWLHHALQLRALLAAPAPEGT